MREWIVARLALAHSIFHWKYTSVLGFGLWLAGIGAMISDKFVVAIFLYTTGGLWLCGWWLIENPAHKPKRASATTKYKKRLVKRWVGVASLVLITLVPCGYTLYLRAANSVEGLKAERDDSFDKLIVAPIPLSAIDSSRNIGFSITNGAHQEIAEHKFSCLTRGIYNDKAVGASNSTLVSPTVQLLGMLGGGRGETAYCYPEILVPGPIICVDLYVSVEFTLTGQPREKMNKGYRFVGQRNPSEFIWTQQSPKNNREFCGEAFGK